MKLEIPDELGVGQFCRCIVITKFKEFLLISLNLKILSIALRLKIKVFLYSVKNNILNYEVFQVKHNE
jgi:hypothetical protein